MVSITGADTDHHGDDSIRFEAPYGAVVDTTRRHDARMSIAILAWVDFAVWRAPERATCPDSIGEKQNVRGYEWDAIHRGYESSSLTLELQSYP